MKPSKPRRRLLLVAFDDKLSDIVRNDLPSLFELVLIRSMEELEFIAQDAKFNTSANNCSPSHPPGDIVVYAMRETIGDELRNLKFLRTLLPDHLIYLFTQHVSIPLLRVALQQKIEEVLMLPLNEKDKQNFYLSLDKNRIFPAELLNELSSGDDKQVLSIGSLKYSPIADLLNNIEKDYQAGSSIQCFTQGIALSISRLCHMFKELTGMTCSQYLICRKLEEAEHLLTLQQAPVTSVAYQLGFANPSHFSRTFKEHFGVTPSAFSETNNKLTYSLVFTQFQKVRLELFPSLYVDQAEEKEFDHATQNSRASKHLQA